MTPPPATNKDQEAGSSRQAATADRGRTRDGTTPVLRNMVICIAVVAFILALTALLYCRFIDVEAVLTYSYRTDYSDCSWADEECDYEQAQKTVLGGVGFFKQCVIIVDGGGMHLIDQQQQLAPDPGVTCKVFAVLVLVIPVIAVVAWTGTLDDSCPTEYAGVELSQWTMLGFTAMFLLCALFSSLTWLAFGQSNSSVCSGDLCEIVYLCSHDPSEAEVCVEECKPGPGAYLQLFAAILWIACALMMICIYRNKAKVRDSTQQRVTEL